MGAGCLEAPSALPPVSTRPLPARRAAVSPGTASITYDPLSGIEQSSEALLGVRRGRLPMQPTHPAEGAGLVSACVATTDWAA